MVSPILLWPKLIEGSLLWAEQRASLGDALHTPRTERPADGRGNGRGSTGVTGDGWGDGDIGYGTGDGVSQPDDEH